MKFIYIWNLGNIHYPQSSTWYYRTKHVEINVSQILKKMQVRKMHVKKCIHHTIIFGTNRSIFEETQHNNNREPTYQKVNRHCNQSVSKLDSVRLAEDWLELRSCISWMVDGHSIEPNATISSLSSQWKVPSERKNKKVVDCWLIDFHLDSGKIAGWMIEGWMIESWETNWVDGLWIYKRQMSTLQSTDSSKREYWKVVGGWLTSV